MLLIKKNFIEHLKKKYPCLATMDLESIVADNLLSPFKIELPQSVLEEAKKFIESAYILRSSPQYIKNYKDKLKELDIQDPGNKSIMMSYDFHLTSNNKLKLIEINTNAAFLALGFEMYEVQNKPLPVKNFSYSELKENIEQELLFQKKTTKPNLKIAIIDENPSQQRLFIEFLVYQEIFKSFGWDVKICDYQEDLHDFDFVYNRLNDFYLSWPTSQNLKKLFKDQTICLSPNPFEYFLLADKERLVEWSQPEFLESMQLDPSQVFLLRQSLPYAEKLNLKTAEKLWSERKKMFFKPMRAFGSKQSYKGASISRRVYEEMLTQDFIAQEYVAAPEREFKTPQGLENFKFDLRFYAYQGQTQMVVARLFQGQVTNLRTPYGGFACVEFI